LNRDSGSGNASSQQKVVVQHFIHSEEGQHQVFQLIMRPDVQKLHQRGSSGAEPMDFVVIEVGVPRGKEPRDEDPE
jgi:hypothetical protein